MYKDIAKKLCICYYLCSDVVVLYGQFFPIGNHGAHLPAAAQGENPGKL